MLLELHDEYTYQSLIQIKDLEKDHAKEILKGSFVNDLCELTNEYTKITNSLDRYLQIRKEKGLFDYSSFYQSHWGSLSALHSMANKKAEPAEITHNKIMKWLDFLEFIIFNIDKHILKKKIDEFYHILGEQVSGLKFKLSSLFDTNNVFKAKYRAIGMILHIIEDSYTVSHCRREDLCIKSFYCYTEQSAKIHKKNDYVSQQYKDKLLDDLKVVLETLLNGNSSKTYYQRIFKLSEETVPSSGGGFN